MAISDRALTKLRDAYPDTSFSYLWKTKARFAKVQQSICLFSFDDGDSVAAIAEHAEPWTVGVPDWDLRRKSKRERERAIVRLYVGREIYARRAREQPSDELRAFGERKLARARKRHPAARVELFDLFYVKGFGGSHSILKRTTSSSPHYEDQAGRGFMPGAQNLDACAAHPTWYFLGLEHEQR